MMMVLLLCVQGQESRAKAGPTGADAKVIAHWNVVPYQAFSRPMTIGVVAFHINGIDRVEFQVNGKPVGSANEMTLNKRTNTNEYWFTLDPKNFGPADPENPHLEVEAIPFGSRPVRLNYSEKRKTIGVIPPLAQSISRKGSIVGGPSANRPQLNMKAGLRYRRPLMWRVVTSSLVMIVAAPLSLGF